MTAPASSRSRLLPMRPRDPHAPGRVASSLELFFDLVFVIGVSVASVQLHHLLAEGHVVRGVLLFVFAFFAIWWAWMNFTWFATAFDTDDWLYRVLTIVQMSGVLVLAAGIEPMFQDGDVTIMVLGYVVMRVAMVAQWLRAAHGAGALRRTALTYAGGIAVVQVLWLGMLLLPPGIRTVVLVVLVVAELSVPLIAERGNRTPWHAHHITERYGLFTLIVLGESLLASANAIIEALHEHGSVVPLLEVSVLTLVVTAALWWIYFWAPHHRAIGDFASSMRYGYVHYVVFAAAAAFSAGIELQIDAISGHTELGRIGTGLAVSIPVALFLLGIWWIAMRREAPRVVNIVMPLAALLVLLDAVVPLSFGTTALILVGVVAVLVVRQPLPEDEDAVEGEHGSAAPVPAT